MLETLTKEVKSEKSRFGVVADKGMSSKQVKEILERRATALARSSVSEE